MNGNGTLKKKKRIVPFGNRILVKRRPIGDRLGSGLLVAPDDVKDRLTELADVVYVPDQTFCDQQLIDNSDKLINALMTSALKGDAKAFEAILEFNDYLRIKSIQPGDVLMVGKYVGTDFNNGETGELLSMMTHDGIVGRVVENV